MGQGVFAALDLYGYVTENSSNIGAIANVLDIPASAIAFSIGREINNKSYDDIERIGFDTFFKQPDNFVGKDAAMRAELARLPADGPIDRNIRGYANYILRDIGPGKNADTHSNNLIERIHEQLSRRSIKFESVFSRLWSTRSKACRLVE